MAASRPWHGARRVWVGRPFCSHQNGGPDAWHPGVVRRGRAPPIFAQRKHPGPSGRSRRGDRTPLPGWHHSACRPRAGRSRIPGIRASGPVSAPPRPRRPAEISLGATSTALPSASSRRRISSPLVPFSAAARSCRSPRRAARAPTRCRHSVGEPRAISGARPRRSVSRCSGMHRSSLRIVGHRGHEDRPGASAGNYACSSGGLVGRPSRTSRNPARRAIQRQPPCLAAAGIADTHSA